MNDQLELDLDEPNVKEFDDYEIGDHEVFHLSPVWRGRDPSVHSSKCMVTKFGTPMELKDITDMLNVLTNTLAFYADAETYHAISFLEDSPCGEFTTDFSHNDSYDYEKPGARARAALRKVTAT